MYGIKVWNFKRGVRYGPYPKEPHLYYLYKSRRVRKKVQKVFLGVGPLHVGRTVIAKEDRNLTTIIRARQEVRDLVDYLRPRRIDVDEVFSFRSKGELRALIKLAQVRFRKLFEKTGERAYRLR